LEPENAAGYVLLLNIYAAAYNMYACLSAHVEWQRNLERSVNKQLELKRIMRCIHL
jgi:hypothetical protein